MPESRWNKADSQIERNSAGISESKFELVCHVRVFCSKQWGKKEIVSAYIEIDCKFPRGDINTSAFEYIQTYIVIAYNVSPHPSLHVFMVLYTSNLLKRTISSL